MNREKPFKFGFAIFKENQLKYTHRFIHSLFYLFNNRETSVKEFSLNKIFNPLLCEGMNEY